MADEEPPPHVHPIGPIPTEMYSDYESRPFKICTRCGETLFDFTEGFRVSKVYRQGEVLFEYALCSPCFLGILEESSDETKEALYEYQRERIRSDTGSGECVLCGTEREDIENQEFALVAACLRGSLLDINLVCGACIESMNGFVSKQTRDVWDRFVEENFPGIPSDFEPLPSQPAFF